MSIASRILEKILAEGDHKDEGITCFLFKGVDNPEELHVTHKYLETLTEDQVNQVCSILDDWFERNPMQEIKVPFDKVEYFGPEKDVRVLTPTVDPKDFNSIFLLPLKEELDKVRKDDYPTYRPHATCNLEKVTLPIVKYVFIYDEQIVREYEAQLPEAFMSKTRLATLLEKLQEQAFYTPDEEKQIAKIKKEMENASSTMKRLKSEMDAASPKERSVIKAKLDFFSSKKLMHLDQLAKIHDKAAIRAVYPNRY